MSRAKDKENESELVRVGSTSVLLYPWKHPSGKLYWRFLWHDPETGKRKYGTRSTKPNAKKAARDKAVELANGSVDFSKLTDPQRRAITRLLAADPTLAMVDDYLAFRAKAKPVVTVADAVTEFLGVKDAAKGDSVQNVRTLKRHLAALVASFADRVVASITVQELDAHIHSGELARRTRKNVRASLVTFWRWCRNRGYLGNVSKGETAAELTEALLISRTVPDTYSPAELALLLHKVDPAFAPWLALAAFAGIRTEEIYPQAGGTKSPLDWSDIHWSRHLIIVRPETSKTKDRRVVPLLPVLRDWLHPVKQKTGPIGGTLHPGNPAKGGAIAETTRIGEAIGGWKRNALRHSFISYRAAQVGLGQTAMEAGNSETEAKKSYNDAKGKDEAAEWFGLNRSAVAELLRNNAAKPYK